MTPTPYQEARERVAADIKAPFGHYAGEPPETLALVAIADIDALLSGPEGEREAVARVIDPSGWSYWDQFHDRHGHDYASQHIEPSLTKADRVINLLRGSPNDL